MKRLPWSKGHSPGCRFLRWAPFSALAAVLTGAAAAAAPATLPATGFHDQVVSEYLDGKWEKLETDLAATKDPAGLSAADRADMETIRRAMGECRPEWWKLIKAGKRVNFRPVVWGHAFGATYDPQIKTSVLLNYVGTESHVTVKWDVADMDNPAQAEHGFTKGELNDMVVWLNLGMAQSWADIPIDSQVNLNADARVRLNCYLQFRSNVAGACYGNPRARRWALWLDLAAWEEKYAKMEGVMGRRAVGAMFAAEVVAHADHYPSIRLPNSLPDQGAEEKLANQLRPWIEKHGMTLAEDQSLRDALKAFAAANTGKVRQTAMVTLPNGLTVALEPDADKKDAEKRDAWLKAHLTKTP
jgi:hypothetical protein